MSSTGNATGPIPTCLPRMNNAARAFVLIAGSLALTACGPTTPQATGSATTTAAPVKLSELQRRQRTACVALGPKLTQCAVADARASMSPAELAKLDIGHTAPKHTEVFIDECSAEQYSSRQVRVLEVCFREESECDLLTDCLANIKPTTPPAAP
jgi:hypothetical protein